MDTLSIDAAIEFLLERTHAKRRKQVDDDVQARILAEMFGGLALALEQAGPILLSAAKRLAAISANMKNSVIMYWAGIMFA